MKFLKDLIIVHFQDGFFNASNQELKNRVKTEIQSLVNKAQKASDIHISFWEDRTISNQTSVVAIPPLSNKVSTQDAPAGVVNNYRLKGPEVILTGGWFGACISNAINSVIFAFFENPELVNTGSFDIRLHRNAVYKSSEVLSDISDANIKNGIESAMNISSDILAQNDQIRNRGLRIRILRAGEPAFHEQLVIKADGPSIDAPFLISFLLVD